jgi:putative transposase
MIRSEERKQNRLKTWDYSSEGWYFVTICTKNREEYFGKIENGEIVLNEYGNIAKKCWEGIKNHFDGCELDEFIVMPNHVHGIVAIEPFDLSVGNRHACSLRDKRNHQKIPVIIGSFKSAVTKKINESQEEFLFQWQKSFHDHIIRNDKALKKIREYIYYNVDKWAQDEENPQNIILNKS